MSSTDIASDKFFAGMLLSLRHAMTRRNESFYPTSASAAVESYWEAVASRTSGIQELPEARDGAAMLRLLGELWDARGERYLRLLLPGLEELRQQMLNVDDKTADEVTQVTQFVYPLH